MFLTLVKASIDKWGSFENSLPGLGFESNHSSNTKVLAVGDFEGYPNFERISFDEWASFDTTGELFGYLKSIFLANDIVTDEKTLNYILSPFMESKSIVSVSTLLREFLSHLWAAEKNNSLIIFHESDFSVEKHYSHLIFKEDSEGNFTKRKDMLVVAGPDFKTFVKVGE